MTPKLNQIIAVANGKKTQAHKTITEIHQLFQKPDLMEGMVRTYTPDAEDGEHLPDEKKIVQVRVSDGIKTAVNAYTELFNIVATQDYANTKARADIVVEGVIVLAQVPVTHLLFIEKQLVDIHTFVDKLPTLSASEEWKFDDSQDLFVSASHTQNRNKKVLKNHILHGPTDKHPAQVTTYNEEQRIGQYHSKKYSGAIQTKYKNSMLERVRKLQEAVKLAREHANSIEAEPQNVAKPVLEFIFNGK